MEANNEKPNETPAAPAEAAKPEAVKPAEAPKVETGRKPKTTYGGNNKFNRFNNNKKPSGPPSKRF
jgi:hypothetical protein